MIPSNIGDVGVVKRTCTRDVRGSWVKDNIFGNETQKRVKGAYIILHNMFVLQTYVCACPYIHVRINTIIEQHGCLRLYVYICVSLKSAQPQSWSFSGTSNRAFLSLKKNFAIRQSPTLRKCFSGIVGRRAQKDNNNQLRLVLICYNKTSRILIINGLNS